MSLWRHSVSQRHISNNKLPLLKQMHALPYLSSSSKNFSMRSPGDQSSSPQRRNGRFLSPVMELPRSACQQCLKVCARRSLLFWAIFIGACVVYTLLSPFFLFPDRGLRSQDLRSPCQIKQAQTLPRKPNLSSIASFDIDLVRKNARNLVLVTGHAVIVAEDLNKADENDDVWYLLEYQKHSGLPQAFVSHIKKGIEIAHEDPEALLIFSGGQTRKSAGPRSEGAGYFMVADHYSWWNMTASVRTRTSTEEFARDSFENLLFSVCRFREITGRFPEKITLLSFSFKEQRFVKYHRAALKIPVGQFSFVGIDPPASTGFDLKRLNYWEQKAALKPFKKDMYGCRSKVLVEKREERNPFFRTHPYEMSCPEIRGLFSWCGPGLYSGKLPWSI